MATPRVKPEDRKKRGRPSKYTQPLADRLCTRLALGESLRTVCASRTMPSMVTVFAWMRKHPDFLSQYTRAKEESADAMAEEVMDISDDGRNDWMEKFDKDGESIGYQLNGEAVQRSKLRVDTRKWLMAKMKPKKYGDKLELGGGMELTHKKFEQMEDEELDAAIAGAKDTSTTAAS